MSSNPCETMVLTLEELECRVSGGGIGEEAPGLNRPPTPQGSASRPNLLEVDADAVLRAQGADPARLRARRPALVQVAEQAVAEGMPLVAGRIFYRRLRVSPAAIAGVTPENISGVTQFPVGARGFFKFPAPSSSPRALSAPGQISLAEDGLVLAGALSRVARHLAAAESLVVAVCTIGEQVEQRASALAGSDPLLSLALDAFGSAAAEALGNLACRYFEMQAAAEGLQAATPIGPGAEDWPVEQGQPQIFDLLQPDPTLVRLNPSGWMMLPRKSLSMVVGIGSQVERGGSSGPCQFCTLALGDSAGQACQFRSGRQG